MSKDYIGIDPGKKGAVAIITTGHPGETTFIQLYDNTPTALTKLFGKTENYRRNNIIVALEKVHSMPKQGVASSFNFGVNYGWFLGALDTCFLSYRLVTPQEWQKSLGVLGQGKDKAEHKRLIYEAARRLFPTAELTTKRGAILDGRADALMIAYWLYLQENKEGKNGKR